MITFVEGLPAGIVIEAGTCAAGESLLRLITAPPAGAWPFSITIEPLCAPPLIELVLTVYDLIEGGSTFTWADADPEFSVAVIVTGVEAVTCPACIWNCVQPMFAGMFTVAGTGRAFGLELVRFTTAPPAGAPLSCSCTNVVSPLKSGFL